MGKRAPFPSPVWQVKVEKAVRPVGCTTERFPLRPPGRGGNPLLALWLLSQLQGEAAPCVEFRRGQADASKINSSDCSSSLLGIRLGSGFAFVRIHDPSFDERPPKDTGLWSRDPTGLPGRDPRGAKGKAGLGGGGRTLLAAAGFAPRRLVSFPPSSAMFRTHMHVLCQPSGTAGGREQRPG